MAEVSFDRARELGGIDPVTGEQLAYGVPWYVRLIRVARWLGVAPWDLAHQSLFWLVAAENVANGEHELELQQQEQQRGDYRR